MDPTDRKLVARLIEALEKIAGELAKLRHVAEKTPNDKKS